MVNFTEGESFSEVHLPIPGLKYRPTNVWFRNVEGVTLSIDFRALRGVRSGETSGAHIFERLAERELAMTNNQIK